MLTLLVALLFAQDGPIERKVDVIKDVVVLVNELVPESIALGEYYAEKRGIPKAQICRVKTVADEACTWAEFRTNILGPLKTFLETRPDVLYIVPTWGVPVKTIEEKIDNDGKGQTPFVSGRDFACIDREIELLKHEHEIEGWLMSKRFQENRHITLDDAIYIVSRLDGPTPESARALVDNALYGEAYGIEGTMVIDTRGLTTQGDGYTECDDVMKQTTKVCEAYGIPFTHDDKPEVLDLSAQKDLSHYWGWYTGNIVCSDPNWRFMRGAIGAHLHSFSAMPLRKKDQQWTGPLIQRGITCTWGTVYEPLISGFPYGTIAFERFFHGYTFGEAMVMSLQTLSWVAVFVGDPLYAPYAAGMKDRQGANRKLAKDAYASIVAALDVNDLTKSDEVVRQVASIGIPYAGGEDTSFLLREMRARRVWPDKKGIGTIADLRKALAAAEQAYAKSDLKSADEHVRRALAISPANVEANILAARVAMAKADGVGALKAIEIAEKVELPFELRLLKARALRLAKKAKEAIAEFEAALAIKLDVPALGELGELLIEQKRYQDAIDRLEAVYKKSPADREIAGELGKAYVATKEWKKAIGVLDNAVKDLPEVWSDVKDYVQCFEQLLAAVRGDGDDKARVQSLGELVKELKSSKVRTTPQAQKIADGFEAGRDGAETLGGLPTYDDKFNGLARVRLGNKTAFDLTIYVVGPMSVQTLVRKGTEKGPDFELVPGVYKLLCVTVEKGRPRAFLRQERLEPSRHYALALDDAFKPYRPTK